MLIPWRVSPPETFINFHVYGINASPWRELFMALRSRGVEGRAHPRSRNRGFFYTAPLRGKPWENPMVLKEMAYTFEFFF